MCYMVQNFCWPCLRVNFLLHQHIQLKQPVVSNEIDITQHISLVSQTQPTEKESGILCIVGILLALMKCECTSSGHHVMFV